MPPCRTAPLCSAAPDRMLQVCPGWMPTPVACLLNSPEMTLSRGRSGASGSRLLLSSMSAPAPLADQFLGLMPLPMNKAAKRCGCAAAAVPGAVALPQPETDSSQGRAIVTPTPLSSVRRVIAFEESITAVPQVGGRSCGMRGPPLLAYSQLTSRHTENASLLSARVVAPALR